MRPRAQGKTALAWAAEAGHAHVTEALLEWARVPVASADADGGNPGAAGAAAMPAAASSA